MIENLPDWMMEGEVEELKNTLASVPRFPRTKEAVELREQIYDQVFEYALDHIASGTPMTAIVGRDPRNIDYARFIRWIKKNPVRLQRYNEAQEISAELYVDRVDNLLADDERSVDEKKLSFEILKYKAAMLNKKKFGNNKHIELASTDLTDDKIKNLSTKELNQMILEQTGIDPTIIGESDE